MQFHSVMLGVRDVAVSREFYGEKLGLTPCGGSEDFAFFDAGGTMIVLSAVLARSRPPTAPAAVEIVLRVESVRASSEALRARGVVFTTEPHSIDATNDVANLEDPDGHLLTLYGPS